MQYLKALGQLIKWIFLTALPYLVVKGIPGIFHYLANFKTYWPTTLSVGKYLIFAFIDVVSIPVNLICAPFVALAAKEKFDDAGNSLGYWLPDTVYNFGFFQAPILWYFQTPDNPLDGDAGFKAQHRFFKNDADVDTNPWKIYVNHVLWMIRNSLYGFAIDVMGAKLQEGFTYEFWGDQNVSNRPLLSGLIIRRATNPDGTVYWQWYYVQGWLDGARCVRINLGWKLWQNPQPNTNCQFVFSPNPFMGAAPTA